MSDHQTTATPDSPQEGVFEMLMGAVRSLEQTVRMQTDLLKRLTERVRELETAIEEEEVG